MNMEQAQNRKEFNALARQLVRNRRKRVNASDEEGMDVILRLTSEFSGRDLATALAAEGFGTMAEVRLAATRFTLLSQN